MPRVQRSMEPNTLAQSARGRTSEIIENFAFFGNKFDPAPVWMRAGNSGSNSD
jgi:hypothetical protein